MLSLENYVNVATSIYKNSSMTTLNASLQCGLQVRDQLSDYKLQVGLKKSSLQKDDLQF